LRKHFWASPLNRRQKKQNRGRKLRGKAPKAPEPGPQAKYQANFTDGDSRIMPTTSDFAQAYNAQTSVIWKQFFSRIDMLKCCN
jgi:phosphatidate phosphatase APP1